MAIGALKFKNTAVARQPQELGRLRVLAGADAGAVFVITAPRVSIGRGEENEIVVMDLKMSRRHAEVTQSLQGMFIRDLGSSNGVLINGQPTPQGALKTGDKIGMGSTVFEFLAPEAGTKLMLMSPPASAPVGSGLSGFTRFIQKPSPLSAAAGAGPNISFLERNKKLALIMGVLLVMAFLMPQAEVQVKKRRKKYQAPSEVSAESQLKNFLPQIIDAEAKKKSTAYFKEGYREFKEKNYLRAKTNFEIALQIMPSHEMAKIYMQNVAKAMEDDAKELKALAKRDIEGNRLRTALDKYDAIRRLYFKEQTNVIYMEADKAYKELELKLKVE